MKERKRARCWTYVIFDFEVGIALGLLFESEDEALEVLVGFLVVFVLR